MINQPISQFMHRDVLSGEMDTPLFEVISQMKSLRESEFIVCNGNTPVGVITEQDAVSILSDCLKAGRFQNVPASVVMTRPVHSLLQTAEMGEVIRVMNEHGFRRVPITNEKFELTGIVNLLDLQYATNSALEKRGRDLEVAVMERTSELMKANAKLAEISVRDGLTGLLNRRAMTEELEKLHATSLRYGNSYSVILTDIDHFKLYNDSLGHIKGDEALKTVAEILSAAVRTSDSVFRYGGEEFLVTMPETEAESALVLAERLREMVVDKAIAHPASPSDETLTLSLGVSDMTQNKGERFPSWSELVEEADRALYDAKQGGRNRVIKSS